MEMRARSISGHLKTAAVYEMGIGTIGLALTARALFQVYRTACILGISHGLNVPVLLLYLYKTSSSEAGVLPPRGSIYDGVRLFLS